MKITAFAKVRGISSDAVTTYIRRHKDDFEGHTWVTGNAMHMDEVAERLLDEKYPLYSPTLIVDDAEARRELVEAHARLKVADGMMKKYEAEIIDLRQRNEKLLIDYQAEKNEKLLIADKQSQDAKENQALKDENKALESELRQQAAQIGKQEATIEEQAKKLEEERAAHEEAIESMKKEQEAWQNRSFFERVFNKPPKSL